MFPEYSLPSTHCQIFTSHTCYYPAPSSSHCHRYTTHVGASLVLCRIWWHKACYLRVRELELFLFLSGNPTISLCASSVGVIMAAAEAECLLEEDVRYLSCGSTDRPKSDSVNTLFLFLDINGKHAANRVQFWSVGCSVSFYAPNLEQSMIYGLHDYKHGIKVFKL